MVCSDPESCTDHSLKEVNQCIHYFGTGCTHGAPRVNATSSFCVILCIFTNDIHVSVKNSSADDTYHIVKR